MYLTQLDVDLLPLAGILSSSSVGVEPESFFRESESMRLALIEGLKSEGASLWMRLRFKEKVRKGGEKVWKQVLAKLEGGAD